jgi:hypothetical protein
MLTVINVEDPKMTDSKASFSFSFADGTLKIEGSELFVSQQMDAFRDTILDSLNAFGKPALALPAPTHVQTNGIDSSGGTGNDAEVVELQPEGNPFPRVLDTMGDRLKITTAIKGKTTAEKAINLILAYLWGKERLLNEPTAEYKELRELCEEHACLDSSNISTTLSSKKSLILVDGAKGSTSKICKLTYPGREAAEEVLEQLSGGPK